MLVTSMLRNNLTFKFLLLIASVWFYANAGLESLVVLLVSVFLNFAIYRLFFKEKISSKIYLYLVLALNLMLLGYFKYSLFILDEVFGLQSNLRILLPLGISFFTFQQISFGVDTAREKVRIPFIDYSLYVTFFPQLVAGPIVRSTELLPQFKSRPHVNYTSFVKSARYILYGFFKKVIIADSLALYTSDIFANYSLYSGGDLALNLFYYSIVIYSDFSGYTDMAIGFAGLLGYSLPKNFNFPYFSKNIHAFWNNWHITLSSWFKQYVYFPLGGSRGSEMTTIGNIGIVFLLSGIWHGAAFGYLIWGIMHVLLYLFYRSYSKFVSLSIPNIISGLLTFSLVTLAWVPFALEDFGSTLGYYELLFSDFSVPKTNRYGVIYIGAIFLFEILFYFNGKEPFNFNQLWLRWPLYLLLVWLSMRLFVSTGDFVYFRF